MGDTGLRFQPLTTVAGMIGAREISAVEVVEVLLDEIGRTAPVLNCFIEVLAGPARRRAEELDALLSQGTCLGPLHGIPVALKDNIETADAPTTAGSPTLRGHRPSRNAVVVDRLLAAGAVIIAKANLYEFAYGAPHPQFGPVRNPWNVDRTAGGSSNGSAAAVAAGLCYAALGTDTGGSIRVPAAFCGVVGLKPTYGMVSTDGVIPLSPSLDHVGPLARTVADSAVVLSVIAGEGALRAEAVETAAGPRPLSAASLSGVRLGLPRPWPAGPIEPDVRRSLDAAAAVFAEAGASLVELPPPEFSAAQAVAGLLMGVEAAEYHRVALQAGAPHYNPVLRGRLEAGVRTPREAYDRAQRDRERLTRHVDALFDESDVLLLPAHPASANLLSEQTVVVDGHAQDVFSVNTRFTRLFNLTGHPAIVVPCGIMAEGLPIALQLVARRWEEAALLRAAAAYEQATPWHTRHPSLTVD